MCTYKLSYLGASLLVSVYISYMHIHKNIYMGMIDGVGVSYSVRLELGSLTFYNVWKYFLILYNTFQCLPITLFLVIFNYGRVE